MMRMNQSSNHQSIETRKKKWNPRAHNRTKIRGENIRRRRIRKEVSSGN